MASDVNTTASGTDAAGSPRPERSLLRIRLLLVVATTAAMFAVGAFLVVRAQDAASTSGGALAAALPERALAPGVLAFTDPVPAARDAPTGLDRTIEVIDRTPDSPTYGQVVSIDPDGLRRSTGVVCDRFHERNGVAVCVAAGPALSEASEMTVFDRVDHGLVARDVHRFQGAPSRVRLSEQGDRLGFTTFVTGHGYGDPGSLSTFTAVIAPNERLLNLEEVAVADGDRDLSDESNNFWGASFAPDGERLVVTMSAASGPTSHLFRLIEVDPASTSGRVVGEGECPSWSPDGSTIVVKDRVTDGTMTLGWRLVAIDVVTGERTVLPEARSIDDQVEWFDEHTILYAVDAGGSALRPRRDVYSLRVDDPDARPRLVATGAESPSAPSGPDR